MVTFHSLSSESTSRSVELLLGSITVNGAAFRFNRSVYSESHPVHFLGSVHFFFIMNCIILQVLGIYGSAKICAAFHIFCTSLKFNLLSVWIYITLNRILFLMVSNFIKLKFGEKKSSKKEVWKTDKEEFNVIWILINFHKSLFGTTQIDCNFFFLLFLIICFTILYFFFPVCIWKHSPI